MQSYTFDFTGAEDGPRYTDAYKRAVYKQPPRNFAVQVLPPQKFGNSYSYGMLISPLKDSSDRHSIISRSSGSSGSSNESRASTTVTSMMDTSSTAPLPSDYEIWRRWEDCLYFQDILENEYGRMSREKRARLQAGKGVKKNGVYMHQDPARRLHHAASFESLPPGPDPNMIAKDVHEILPRLTKKGALFKASKDTIEQRGSEFRALIETLLCEGDDVPALIRDLRQLRVVRDFFGFWRRDKDRIVKQFGGLPEGSEKFSLRERSESVGSRASSIFSNSGGMGIYFSPSNLSLQLPSPTPADQVPTNKSPRRPAFMQGGKGAITLVPPSPNEAGSSREPATPRRRAQTLQASSSAASGSANDMRVDLQEPPASAPASATFAGAMENGYTSDSASAASSGAPVSPQASPVTSHAHQTVSPMNSHPMRASRGQMEVRFSDIILADEADTQRKSMVENDSGAIIVNMEDLPFEEDGRPFVGRDHSHYLSQSIDARLGHRLQDLTIKEEDERDLDDEGNEIHYGYAQSDFQPSGSSNGHETSESVGRFSEHSSHETDDRTINDAERPKSSAWSYLSTVSSARIAAARREALRSLTGGDAIASIQADRNLAQQSEAPTSARSSVLTVTSGSGSGSGSSSSASTNSGRVHSSDTHSSIDSGRPYSYQSSIVSCEDIDRTLSSSPVTLHSPILEEYDADSGYSTGRRQSAATSGYRPHDSISSVQTFMTDTSVDAIIPPRPSRQLRATSSRPSAGVARMANMVDSQRQDDTVELRDSYFFGLPTTSNEPTPDRVNGIVHDSPIGRGSPPGRRQRRPMSPGLNNAPKPLSNSISPAPPIRSISPSPSTSTYAPSIVTSISEESGVNAVSIKAIYGEHIIAFRIDRNSSLTEVREKLRHKLVNQQGVSLSDKFSVAYKPPGPGRVQELRRAFGRSRSSSVSSIGATNPNSLRILFTQRDWMETVGSCPSGAKVTLHVLNG